MLLFILIVVVALFAPTIAPYDPSAVHVRDRLQLPSSGYLLGTACHLNGIGVEFYGC